MLADITGSLELSRRHVAQQCYSGLGRYVDIAFTAVNRAAALEAADGRDALKILRSNHEITMLITDVGLPDGMLEHGMEVMTKPLALHALASKIREMIH